MKLKESLVRCRIREALIFTGEFDSKGRSIAHDRDGDVYAVHVKDSYGFDIDLYKDDEKVGYVNAYDGTLRSV